MSFEVTVTSLLPPHLCRFAVFSVKPTFSQETYLLTLQEKIKKLAGSAAGAGRRWLRRLRSQTQALTAQEATFEGRGEREEISLRQCVLRDHQIRIGSGLFIHSAST